MKEKEVRGEKGNDAGACDSEGSTEVAYRTDTVRHVRWTSPGYRW